MKTTAKTALLMAAGAMALTACANNSRSRTLAYVERPVEVLYNNAADELDKRDYSTAVLLFAEVERQHPYSEWARRAAVMSAYASYKQRRYDEAIASAQNFISLNPGNENAAYAYYIIAMSYFEQIMDVGRDQRTTELAQAALTDILLRYPESEFARDASLKLDMVNDQLAGKEMAVGRWYLRRDQTLPAINRFRRVITDFETTSHAPEALHRLVEAYLTLGLRSEAQAVGAVLGYNHPESQWYRDTYRLLTKEGLNPDDVPEKKRRSIFSRLF